VKWVQRRLGFKPEDVDGKFGAKTDTAIRKLQMGRFDLVVDGIVGPRTFAYLSWLNP
jgi:peptidoglycan hydrolase-like protein with peptidoglycan-binding domain